MKKLLLSATSVVLLSALLSVSANAQTVVYTETFDPAPETLTDFNMQLGGNPDLKPSNAKILTLGQWGLTSNGSITAVGGDNGNALQPQLDTKNNGRVAVVFLDPALFSATGAGTYTLVFDVIASSSPGAGRVYVGAASGYDLSGVTDSKVSLPLSPAGFGVKKVDGTAAWLGLVASGGATASDLVTTNTEWILGDGTPQGVFLDVPGADFDVEATGSAQVSFDYDGTSALAVAFGGYNTDFKVDNLSIVTGIPQPTSWAGYSITDGYVDTGSFMGSLYVLEAPWIYSVDLGSYIYLPESAISEAGAWFNAPK